MQLSIVIPAYNESEGIEAFHTDHLMPNLKKIKGYDFEVIYVNDGSDDDTLEKLAKIAKSEKSIKVVNLSRNFGKEIATTAGLHYAKGDAAIIMDSDGQHPPKDMPKFVKKWEAGAQVVVGVRNSNQKEGLVKKIGSKAFYQLFNSTSGTALVPRSTDYRLIDRCVIDEFMRFTERQRITRGLIDWLGFKRDYVYFDSPARLAGQASYKTGQLVKLAMNSFTSLSLKPLFFFGWVGVVITASSLFIGTFVLVEQVILGDPLQLGFTGTALLGILMTFLVGLILISQAVLAVYLSHVHQQAQDRPLFVIDPKESIGL
jgi:glycosyltransferase involved in cell wall biosynthesis